MPDWQKVGAVEPPSLAEARLSVHWATQAIPAVADAALKHADDDSHSNMLWSVEHQAFLGRTLPSGVRVGLRIPSCEAIVVDDKAAVTERFAVEGKTLAACLDRLGRSVGLSGPLTLRDYDMPDHPTGRGGPFVEPSAESLEELRRWCGNGSAVLEELASGEEGAPEVACWPHHFDLGGVVVAGEGRQVGFGLSFGDHNYAEPYFYVSPSPVPDGTTLPELDGGGHWHREGFTGAVLLASKLGESQADQVEAYLTSAMQAAHRIAARDNER